MNADRLIFLLLSVAKSSRARRKVSEVDIRVAQNLKNREAENKMLRLQGMDDPDLLSCLFLSDVPGATLLYFSIIDDLLQLDNNKSHRCRQ